MGIAVQELLANEYFRDFEVIAGQKGLSKEIQGMTSLEAPDGFKWTKGKEMVLSSGYVISQNPDCIDIAFAEGNIQRTSGLMLKRDRYLDKIPESLLEKFNQHEIPLIIVPFSMPWMEIISQANVAVMNRTIMKFQLSTVDAKQVTNQSYKEQKIRKTLQSVEREMKFPAMLYDFSEETPYYSSSRFPRSLERYDLTLEDCWNPSKAYTHHTLCDYINMSRYRLINEENTDGPRISWIIMPITVGGRAQAYFVVMEERGWLDYYDEFTIRIAYLAFQSLYEQIAGAKDVGYMGFENFIHFALTCSEEDASKVISQAGIQGISMSIPYDHVLIEVDHVNVSDQRDEIMKAYQTSSISRYSKLAVLDGKEVLLLLEPEGKKRRTLEDARKGLEEFFRNLGEELPSIGLRGGICREGKTLRDIKYCVKKCRKVLEMGPQIFPKQRIYDYEMLGPLAWLDIPEEELTTLLQNFSQLQETDKGKELLRTLKVYLENNMNYSVTADILYVHINTIRKRIDKADNILHIDWDDPVERMKTILLLQFANID